MGSSYILLTSCCPKMLYRLAPDDQKEDWHQSLTERNESRLPEKLRSDLSVAKRRAEQGLKKTGSDLMSYFLVEFMGSHEFIWVKESDIIENFDPDEDVNIAAASCLWGLGSRTTM